MLNRLKLLRLLINIIQKNKKNRDLLNFTEFLEKLPVLREKMDLSDIIVILCRVSEPGNLGAVCRAMKNMGLRRLRIAGTSRESLDEAPLLARAIHAADIWEKAEFYENLAEAGADCSLLIGTTRRRGRRRKHISIEAGDLAAWLREKQGRAGIVFGNERTGLEDAELDLCNAASHIPVAP